MGPKRLGPATEKRGKTIFWTKLLEHSHNGTPKEMSINIDLMQGGLKCPHTSELKLECFSYSKSISPSGGKEEAKVDMILLYYRWYFIH